ncbi:hypothetical protein AB832_07710 [Flavobacteriaceae bacterium (ex Bugula neritina AB1)]|nr:hypothetical protein AB832_07710 [Flavobacteriaceae bacterium (ex Bugula neritina AB1)]
MELLEIIVLLGKNTFEIREEIKQDIEKVGDRFRTKRGYTLACKSEILKPQVHMDDFDCIQTRKPCIARKIYCLPKDKDKAIRLLKDAIINRADELIQGAMFLQNSIIGKTIIEEYLTNQ